MDPTLLTVEEILAIHGDQISRYGGAGGVRDAALLESAVAMPGAAFEGKLLHTELCEMAAAYLFHIVQNHPFVDGNKRAGAVAADVFLRLNGLCLTADDDAYAELVLAVARGEASKPEIAAFFRANAEPQSE